MIATRAIVIRELGVDLDWVTESRAFPKQLADHQHVDLGASTYSFLFCLVDVHYLWDAHVSIDYKRVTKA